MSPVLKSPHAGVLIGRLLSDRKETSNILGRGYSVDRAVIGLICYFFIWNPLTEIEISYADHLGRYRDNIGRTKTRIAGVNGAQVLRIEYLWPGFPFTWQTYRLLAAVRPVISQSIVKLVFTPNLLNNLPG